jgi:hypothetical protein
VHGRDKDMINRGCEKITAEEIESLVRATPGIQIVEAGHARPEATTSDRTSNKGVASSWPTPDDECRKDRPQHDRDLTQ